MVCADLVTYVHVHVHVHTHASVCVWYSTCVLGCVYVLCSSQTNAHVPVHVHDLLHIPANVQVHIHCIVVKVCYEVLWAE